jgi:septation ring formation regulator EzrA
MFMKLKIMLAAIVFSVAAFTGCDSAKTSAEMAVKAADSSYQAIAAEAQEYVPDQARSVQDTLQQAKTSLSNGDYSTALAAAKTLPEKITHLADAVKARKEELTAMWTDFKNTMPGMVAGIENRVDTLKKKHTLPAGADSELAALKQTWDQASSSFQSGDISSAIEKAGAAKQKVGELQKMLGIKAS